MIGIHDDAGDIENEWYDNTALAARHTPRLNRFLGAIRALAATYGAKWSYEVAHNKNYRSMVSESGITV